jgi:ribonucleoside-diphosphate reductase alpha chain
MEDKNVKRTIEIERYFSKQGNPYDIIPWERSEVTITDDQGKFLYKQSDVEFPVFWSSLARKIVASKYFYGENGTDQREKSAKNLIDRVTGTISDWGISQGYFNKDQAQIFKDELAALAITQKMAFNSPVWFNVGIDRYLAHSRKMEQKNSFIFDKEKGKIVTLPIGSEYAHPQTSACFIQSVDDTMEDIMQLAYNEAMLFKYGSGTGTDLSTLRSSREKLSGGGVPSGPLAYLLFYDRVAGIVKSGGKTRRAAKMDSLRVEHPDIVEFIEAKSKERKKLEVLMDSGGISYSEAETTVGYQNTNLSVRVSDAFMEAVEKDKDWQTIPVHNKDMLAEMPRYKARELFRKIAEGTHSCGDPGIQFHDTINKWHTCSNSAPINASNPCSEYMNVDNSSCNLASHNLMRFINEKGEFDVEGFSKAIKFTAIAQDLLYDASSFPTRKIAENSHKFRPLGMGYSNLGALEMFLGLPYDSDSSRAVAAAITALMTSKVYETSTEMAEILGPFSEFEKNREPMLKVINMHRQALKGIDRMKLPKGLESILTEAEKTWENVEERGKLYGFRNSQATVLAPTGTIGFMMDCDTTGIEPETWLVKQKNLSDGGVLKIVNQTVNPALKRLGYNDAEINNIIEYMKQNGTIEGAPGLKDEHLPVFDCTYKTETGKRIIHYSGHLKMMAAVQPFLSGAISKTVGLPENVSIDDIEKTYMDAWKLGLKAVAIYRDNSKRMQPLMAIKSGLEKKVEEDGSTAARRKLPITAPSIRHKFNVAGHEGYLHIGLYEDGSPGELFIDMSKEGSTIGGLMDAIGILTSMSLQYGAPKEQLVKKLKGQNFEPRGLVVEGDPRIKTADSLVDYIFNFIGVQSSMGHPTIKKEESIKEIKRSEEGTEELGGFCIECGKQMKKKGHCIEKCDCGWINPKGCGE